MNKLALGTVQFGMPYGIANNSEKTGVKEASEILSFAKLNNINTLDTAIEYGDSEQVLGQIGVDDFQVITKLPAAPSNLRDHASWVQDKVYQSQKKLKKKSLYGFLFHKPSQLLEKNGEDLYKALDACKSQGLIKNIGVSIYSPTEELEQVLKNYDFDLVQVPINVFDRSLELDGIGDNLKLRGIEVHARSIFLQGLLLMSPKDRPRKFSRWKKEFDAFDNWLIRNQKTALEATLKYVEQLSFVDKLVIGIDSKKHLEQIIQARSSENVFPPVFFNNEDIRLINPAKWIQL